MTYLNYPPPASLPKRSYPYPDQTDYVLNGNPLCSLAISNGSLILPVLSLYICLFISVRIKVGREVNYQVKSRCLSSEGPKKERIQLLDEERE
jgi:hypothetical protein